MSVSKRTIAPASYWCEKGAYQQEYDSLYASLVPSSGSSETLRGELVRSISKLGYEYYNNGNCNARHSFRPAVSYLHDSDSSEEEEEEVVMISEFYDQLLTLILTHIPDLKSVLDEIRSIIVENSGFGLAHVQSYNDLFDKVIIH